MQRKFWRHLLLRSTQFTAKLIGLVLLFQFFASPLNAEEFVNQVPPSKPIVNAQRAYQYLLKICRLGRRVSGSKGMQQQQQILFNHFSKLGAKVQYQHFDTPHPLSGHPVRMSNLIVSWHPREKQRILLACHYDTLPYPEKDRKNPQGLFLGANDGGSGVALLMELGHHLPQLKPTYGVDFVFFDAEEFLFNGRGTLSLGAKHFAQQYRLQKKNYRYLYGIVVDMIGDRHLNLYLEKNSLKYAPKLTKSIWKTAKQLKIKEFIHRAKHTIIDDHLPLNEIAKIPTCDLIDFDYPHWHTTKDTPVQCSGKSLAKVGQVLLTWLCNVPPAEQMKP